MAQPSTSPDRSTAGDGAALPSPRSRRGGDRAPYLGARARSTGAGARPSRVTSRVNAAAAPSRRRASTAPPAPTPATVWTCGPEPIDPHAVWPAPIVETITAAFSDPGAHVCVLDIDVAPVLDEGTVTPADTGVTEAVRECVRALDRTVATVVVDNQADDAGVPPRPFWADLLTGSAAPSGPPSSDPRASVTAGPEALDDHGGERADLVLASLPASVAERVSLDRLALLAADRLRSGGILAVYTHSDANSGQLTDPTGAIVAAAQHADLLYLQHIIVLHTPARDGHLLAAPAPADYGQARHRASVRGLPAPHLRTHADVLVFAQPATSPPGNGPATAAHPSAPSAGGHQ